MTNAQGLYSGVWQKIPRQHGRDQTPFPICEIRRITGNPAPVVRADDIALGQSGHGPKTGPRKKAFAADGITLKQFSESAGGQVVFHTHIHVIPRFNGVPLRPHTGEMADMDVLAAHAEKIRAAIS